MSSPLIIRSVAPTDFTQWEPLWEGYNSFYKRTLAPEITKATWSRFFDAYEPVHAVVAEKDGQLSRFGSFSFSSQHHNDRADLLFAGFVHG